jgi:hypothetical protein
MCGPATGTAGVEAVVGGLVAFRSSVLGGWRCYGPLLSASAGVRDTDVTGRAGRGSSGAGSSALLAGWLLAEQYFSIDRSDPCQVRGPGLLQAVVLRNRPVA